MQRSDLAQRLVLTAVWLVSFFSCVVGIELYIGQLQNGVAMLVPEDRVELLRPLAILYGGYIAGILAFWYKPLFPESNSPVLRQVRFWLALVCTVALNGVVVYLVWSVHLGSTTTVHENVASASKIAGFMSFIVAPANAYYFGVDTKRE